MHLPTLALLGALGLAASVVSATAAPTMPFPAPSQSSPIEQVSGGCGWGFHRSYRGYCVRNYRYRPYAYRRQYRPYGYYRPAPYYGGGYEPYNRPSPGDHIADQLNAQQLGRGY